MKIINVFLSFNQFKLNYEENYNDSNRICLLFVWLAS